MTDVVLPCLNEAPALCRLLEQMPSGYRSIVADNGPSDGSVEVARRFGARVLSVSQPGYGSAVDGVVCVMDADGSFGCAELPRVADPVLEGTAHLTVGRRRLTSRSAWSPHARLSNAVLAHRLRRTTGLLIHDVGPKRAARRTDLLALDLKDRRLGHPLELLIAAAREGRAIIEVDVAYHPRTAGVPSRRSAAQYAAPSGRSAI